MKHESAASHSKAQRLVSRAQTWGLLVAATSVASMALMSDPVSAGGTVVQPPPPPPVVEPPPPPEGLKGIPVPMPSNLHEFVSDRAAAIRLGKALFWDMQVGSDGKTACASCHFHAGADNRSKNQVSPGLLVRSSPDVPNPDLTFQVGRPNYQFKPTDFPFHKLADPHNRDSAVLSTHNDVASSQGVFKTNFLGAQPGSPADQTALAGDPTFQINQLQTRRVEPRNTPSMINSVFNFRNFWDGRATYLFNGVTPFGAMDKDARVFKANALNQASPVTVRIDKASLASLATGPALSDLEMSAIGRTWPKIGARLLSARPLVQQAVSPTDSTLAGMRDASGKGLNATYMSMVQAAFRPEWWKATNRVEGPDKAQYSQAEMNFSMFFGLAIQMYGSTLVSDDSPFDRHMAGDGRAMSTDAKLGMAIFHSDKGKCSSCHVGAEFTGASTRRILRDGPLSRMVMGDGKVAVYDEGFYNISIGKTLNDIANGAKNGVNRPMSTTALAQQVGSAEFQNLIGIPANIEVKSGERIAINGAFKAPSVRNVELTAPYFHNGSVRTLEEVVEFYNRGGNHHRNNFADLDADIQPLGLSADERKQLVAFLKSLTDDRVRLEKAPFDHPQLVVPNGHEVDSKGNLVNDGGKAKDANLEIPAVGREGLAKPQPNFLENADSKYFSLVAQHSGKCVDVAGYSMADGGNVYQWGCHGGDNQLWEEVPANGGFMLRSKMSGKCMDVSGISYAPGANIYQWSCHGGANQVFNWSGSRLVVSHSRQCVNVAGASMVDSGNVVQWNCSTTATNDQFAKR